MIIVPQLCSTDSKNIKKSFFFIYKTITIMSNTENQYIDWLEQSISHGFINSYKYSDFKDIKRIGKGSFGEVFRVTWKTRLFALKSFIKDEQTLKQVVREIKSHQKVNIHDNILRFCGITRDTSAQTKKYFLVLEYADSDTLKTYLEKHFNELNWDDKYQLAFQLASAVECMHNCDIIHCDLHSKNILVHKKNIKLADFGLSKIAEESNNASKIHGIIPYIDPKSFDDKNYKLSKKSDVYSIGVLMWQISSGKQPFCDIDNDLSLCLNIKLNGKREDTIDGTPVAYSNLYKECWEYEPNERPEAQKVVSTLESIINGKSDKVVDHVEEIMDELNSLNSKPGGTISSGLSGITINHDDCSLSNMKYKPDERSEVQKVASTLESIVYGRNAKAPDVISGAVEVTKTAVQIGDSLNIAKGTLQVIGNAADAIAPFMPLIGVATTVISEIIGIYQQAQCNKKIVSALYNRIKLAEYAVNTLQQRRNFHEKDFKNQEWYNAFNRFVDVLKEIRIFCKEISSTRGYQKYLKSYSIKDGFTELIESYDTVMKDLNFTIAIADDEQRRHDNECLTEDIAEMKQFMNSNDQNMNTVEELRLMRLNLESGKGPETKPKQIIQNEIKDPNSPEENDYRGSNKDIVRRYYKTTIEVACKPYDLSESYQEEYKKRQKELAILSKLSECKNILKFYGLANLDGKNHMIVEWAYYGSLRETYEAYDIPWNRKLCIATDICRAMTFLESVEIYHHDLRCENVMVTNNLEPKLANFEYARSTGGTTSLIGDLMRVVHWLAPEKMFDRGSRYNSKCEIFSFGMLLWELTFEKIPYQGWDMDRIEHHVKSGKREIIIFGPAANERESEIQKILENAIKEAWKHKPQDRILLVSLFNMLERLQSKYKNIMEQEQGLLPQETLDFDGSGTPPQPEWSSAGTADLSECEDFTLNFEIDTMITLEEGIKAHKSQEYEKAWECFKYHAENENSNAKYWMGYYLWEGKFVEKDQEKAASLFKEAADKGIPDAQLRYAFTLQKKLRNKKDREEFLKYLTLAADGGNSTAQYNLGDVYFNGKLASKDEEKGISYLKLAALQSHPNATKFLEAKDIDFTTEPKI